MKIKTVILVFLVSILAFSQDNLWDSKEEKVSEEYPKEFQFLNFFITQAVYNNIYATNDLLKGQTVGRLFGGNTTSTGKNTTYFEQRILPFFIYQPKLLDGKAILRASFEIDWTWGDASYGTGGNFGSAISGDQVNIQTQNVELEIIPKSGWAINLGLQRMFDTPYHPYNTALSTMTYTGYRLAFWGTDGVGISLRHEKDFSRWNVGYYQLYENNIQENDDVYLAQLNYERDLTKEWRQGFSFWYVRDRGNGEGGVSILGEGLTSILNDYNGTFKFPLGGLPYKADIFWLGTNWNFNPEFNLGKFSLNGFLISNFGTVNVKQNDWEKAADILGFSANVRAGYKYGQTAEDIVTLDLLFSSGDEDALDDKDYNGIITANTWGSPGAIFISSGAYLLFPHGNVVNRFISAVSDLSNMGKGLIGGTLEFHKDLIPHKLSVKVGTALASSLYKFQDGGTFIGTELNGRISWTPFILLNVELHAAYMWLGDFYDSPQTNGNLSKKPDNPFTVFTVFKYLMF